MISLSLKARLYCLIEGTARSAQEGIDRLREALRLDNPGRLEDVVRAEIQADAHRIDYLRRESLKLLDELDDDA